MSLSEDLTAPVMAFAINGPLGWIECVEGGGRLEEHVVLVWQPVGAQWERTAGEVFPGLASRDDEQPFERPAGEVDVGPAQEDGPRKLAGVLDLAGGRGRADPTAPST